MPWKKRNLSDCNQLSTVSILSTLTIFLQPTFTPSPSLFPSLLGLVSLSVYQNTLNSSSDQASAVSHSLEAFICYQQLYRTWWTCSLPDPALLPGPDLPDLAQAAKVGLNGLHEQGSEDGGSGPNGCAQNPDSVSGSQEAGLSELLLAAGRRVLSEPHAALQASQRAVADVQRRVGCLVQRHSRGQETEPSSGTTEQPCPRPHTESQSQSTSQSHPPQQQEKPR